VFYDFGHADDAATREGLRDLRAASFAGVAPDEPVRHRADWKLVDFWPRGDIHVLEQP